jgi:hypothetical protein
MVPKIRNKQVVWSDRQRHRINKEKICTCFHTEDCIGKKTKVFKCSEQVEHLLLFFFSFGKVISTSCGKTSGCWVFVLIILLLSAALNKCTEGRSHCQSSGYLFSTQWRVAISLKDLQLQSFRFSDRDR